MRRRILVIEDNHQNMYLTTYLLEHAGYEVLQATDGPAGVRLAEEQRPDLIVLDIQLPQMDGYQVMRALRELPTLVDTAIVAVTSYAMPGDRDRILRTGCTAYLEKPIDPDTFVATVACHVRGGAHA
jgi:CheY-like chemotaxis protein